MIIADMPETAYHARPEFSSTQARRILESRATYKWHKDNPQAPSTSFNVGKAAHTMILGVGSDIIEYPEEHLTDSGAVSTKKATREWMQEQDALGLTPVSPDQAKAVKAMSEAVLAHPVARGLLEQPGIPEASVFGTDTRTGIDLRARFDFLGDVRESGARVAVDVKTTAGKADEHGFAQSVARYGYHIQQAHYLHTLKMATGEAHTAMQFVVIEKAPPYLVNVAPIDDEFAEMGVSLAEESRRRLAECLETGEYPGYPVSTLPIRPPVWLINDYQDRFGGLEEMVV